MKSFLFAVLITIFAFNHASFAAKNQRIISETDTTEHIVSDIQLEKVVFFDTLRQRTIPIAIYTKKGIVEKLYKGIIIINHGYGQNNPNSYLAYSYLTDHFASKGYYVVSIQHELPHDSIIPSSGNLQVLRKPFWERGSDNIHYIISELQKSHQHLNYKNTTLIGHSNGGDIIAYYCTKYPNTVKSIVTLDNRRMALPKSENLRVLSLRSSDQLPDIGVLPSSAEQERYRISIITLPNTPHNSMSDSADDTQRKEIIYYISSFLE